MIAAECSFDAKICDPLIGGTYITLLNTCRLVKKSSSLYSKKCVKYLFFNFIAILVEEFS